MNIKKIILINLLLISVLFNKNIIFAKPMECPELPENELFTINTCNDNNLFSEQVPKHIREINTKFDKQLEEIFYDNVAHPTYSVKMIIQDLRTYNKCFNQLCNKIETDCSSAIKGNPSTRNIWCFSKKNNFLKLQKEKTKYFITANVSRKYRSLYEEKLARIGYRFNKYIHSSSMKDLLEELYYTKRMLTTLVKYPGVSF
jgi:hypothetical protein